MTGRDKATPVVTWLTRLPPRRCHRPDSRYDVRSWISGRTMQQGEFQFQFVRELSSVTEQVLDNHIKNCFSSAPSQYILIFTNPESLRLEHKKFHPGVKDGLTKRRKHPPWETVVF